MALPQGPRKLRQRYRYPRGKVDAAGMNSHLPVMLREVVEALNLLPASVFADGTLGGGGHAEAMARRLGPEGILIGLDRDPAMLERGAERVKQAMAAGSGPRLEFRATSYERIGDVLNELHIKSGVDGVLLDLGVNSMQLDDAGRGFAFSKDGPLDARFNAAEGGPSAADLVNTASEAELARIFTTFGDERLARPIARRIARRRAEAPITRTRELAELVAAAYPPKARHGRTSPATRVFQALRIAVNDELGAVERGVTACMEALAPGGRLAVITFHSGEDRIVKDLFRASAEPRPDPQNPYSATTEVGLRFRLPHRKAIECTAEEAAENPRSRSAKLRVIERRRDTDTTGEVGGNG